MPIVLKSESLKLLEASGAVQTYKGIALPFTNCSKEAQNRATSSSSEISLSPLQTLLCHNPECHTPLRTAITSKYFRYYRGAYIFRKSRNHLKVLGARRNNKQELYGRSLKIRATLQYEGWNFNSGNYLFTTDTK